MTQLHVFRGIMQLFRDLCSPDVHHNEGLKIISWLSHGFLILKGLGELSLKAYHKRLIIPSAMVQNSMAKYAVLQEP